jgi:hypothetical protein
MPYRGGLRGPLRLPGFYDPTQRIQVAISGYTRDRAGAILPNCEVHLYRTLDDLEMDETTSDAAGYYEFRSAIPVETYYVVAYKAGSPDVAGTTLNTLVGT